jgi:hypothetical protein
VADAGAPSEHVPGDPGLVFLGRVVAGQCHELTNAFNVANELCGLHEDLLPRARAADADALARLADLARRIQTQLARGQAIVRHVHRLAHDVGAAGHPFDAREVVERAGCMAAREVHLRQASLEVAVPPEAVVLESDPFRLQQAIHQGIELLLEGDAAGRRVTVVLTPVPEGARVALESASPVPWDHAVDTRLAAIGAVLQAAGGELREMPRHAAIDRLALLVPRRATTRGEVTNAA